MKHPDSNVALCLNYHSTFFSSPAEYTTTELIDMWACHRIDVYLYWIDCIPVGYIITREYNTCVNIDYLMILPSFRGQGLGSNLLKLALFEFDVPVTLECIDELVAFYTNCGFHRGILSINSYNFMCSRPLVETIHLQQSLYDEYLQDRKKVLLYTNESKRSSSS